MNRACPGNTPKFPSVPGTTTISTASDKTRRSGVTNSNCRRSAITQQTHKVSGRFRRHFTRLVHSFVNCADHVEGAFGQIVVVSGDDPFEALNRIFEAD